MGFNTTASSDQATAMGFHTTAATSASLSMGECNSANTSSDKTLFVAGNGTFSGTCSRSDALVVGRDGNVSVEGVFEADPTGANFAGHFRDKKNQNESGDPFARVAFIENTSTRTNADGLAIQVGPTGLTDPQGSNNYISFAGDRNSNGRIEGNGSGGVSYETSGSDYAEELPVAEGEEAFEEADLVGVRGGTISLETEDVDRVMIASRALAVTGNTTPSTRANDVRRVDVAFVGQVPARVRGPVEVGDLIVASGKDDGTARAVSPGEYRRSAHGLIAGQAWSAIRPRRRLAK